MLHEAALTALTLRIRVAIPTGPEGPVLRVDSPFTDQDLTRLRSSPAPKDRCCGS